ncbi:class I SAM-dependent methyltransferase [Gemmatirosa kalamazoonensis]|uniref:class I SAM-dependent methyltransferase n=1 Tax=Gemmatirosa kalamazoonensis TaxID=861299 RepID=UPI00130D6B95|nr:class I SAM-dependent methyltransferase [Gemmatirosa kalamazoonensis]
MTHDALRHFEGLYRAEDEPWSFSERGVETLRHERVARIVAELAPRRTLDLGCSLGQLTRRLAELPTELHAIDLSPTAVRRARTLLPGPAYACGSATELPFAPAAFDAIVASDGLYSWQLGPAECATTLCEIHDALVPGGHAVLTEHMRPSRFHEFVGMIEASPLRVVSVRHFHDRPCYQFEGWLKAVRHTRGARALRGSRTVARALCALGRPFGAAGSRHICVVARREG